MTCPKCAGWMHMINNNHKEETRKCDLCGFTIIIKKKEVTPL